MAEMSSHVHTKVYAGHPRSRGIAYGINRRMGADSCVYSLVWVGYTNSNSGLLCAEDRNGICSCKHARMRAACCKEDYIRLPERDEQSHLAIVPRWECRCGVDSKAPILHQSFQTPAECEGHDSTFEQTLLFSRLRRCTCHAVHVIAER